MRLQLPTFRLSRTTMTRVVRRPWIWFEQRAITLRFAQTAIVLGTSWLLLIPLTVWAIVTGYVPIIAPFLDLGAAWIVAGFTTFLLGASLVSHTLAHIWIARALRAPVPNRIPFYAFADAAQVWPVAHTARHEALIAAAGPFANLLWAVLAYVLWNYQLHPYLDASMLFVACANIGVAVLNLAPGDPLDGGRLVRAIVWGLLCRPALGPRLARWFGALIAGALVVWGIVLFLQEARFSLVTGAGTMFAAALLLLARRKPAWRWEQPMPLVLGRRIVQGFGTCLLLLGLLGASATLVPMTDGVRVPGSALSIEPMVVIPDEYVHQPNGSFLLTTVIDQTPIIAGQWLYARFNPAYQILESERVVPSGVTPQQLVQQNYRLLQRSERTAVVVALRLADYDIAVNGVVIEVIDVQPGSWAAEFLQPGDRILRMNGELLQNSDQLFAPFRVPDPPPSIDLEIDRGDQLFLLSIPFSPPMQAETLPSLDLTVQTVGLHVDAPFPVAIEPQKIIGGPSAGLMFALTVYNEVTPEDLTGGRLIAGTGTINLQGAVGPIGGVEQKVAAAEAAGAEYFLVPSANYADAQRVARRIKVVEVTTIEEAIEFLRSLPPANT